jgi:hypothetical protein
MKKAIQTLATSLAFIVLVAVAARITYAWDQARKIPPGVLGIVPFQQETGNIAYSLAQGKGFSALFRADTGPTAWLAPVYPLLVAGIFKIFWKLHNASFFRSRLSEYSFLFDDLHPYFLCWKTSRRFGRG